MLLLRVLVFLLGFAIVLGTIASATRTFVLPRSASDPLTAVVFHLTRELFRPWVRRARSYAQRDSIMALYAPLSLLALPPVWLSCVGLGYMGMFWAVGVASWEDAFLLSGSSLLTLGFAPVADLPQTILAFSEAAIGLILVALLIAYLPTMYAAFSRREASVAMLEIRAGSPPSSVEMLGRSYRVGRLQHLTEVWALWEVWFAELEESHTSLAALAFFRSPQADRSWVTAAGTVLDAAALLEAAVAVPPDPQAQMCIRGGYVALRRIADFFGVPYEANPSPSDPISITKEEFHDACERLAEQGIPLKEDREQAWRDFAGWRVNYDTVLLALAALTMAPEVSWVSDRSLWHPPRLFSRRGG